MRGIAMAQLGEHARARALLQRAARRFGTQEALARARCIVADAEVALAMRDIQGTPRLLQAATATLTAHGDHANALQARLIAMRRLLLLGRLDAAAQAIGQIRQGGFSAMPPAPVAVAELAAAELALRFLHIGAAQAALQCAHAAARRAGVPALLAEVQDLQAALERPAARRVNASGDQPLRLREVAALRDSGALVVDACRMSLSASARQ